MSKSITQDMDYRQSLFRCVLSDGFLRTTASSNLFVKPTNLRFYPEHLQKDRLYREDLRCRPTKAGDGPVLQKKARPVAQLFAIQQSDDRRRIAEQAAQSQQLPAGVRRPFRGRGV